VYEGRISVLEGSDIRSRLGRRQVATETTFIEEQIAEATPGPWSIITEDHDISVDGEGWFDDQHVNGWVIVGNLEDPGMAIAVIDTGYQNHWNDTVLDANAQLVAAAPALNSDGQFLAERLREFERVVDQPEAAREFYGHVLPALARFEAALASAIVPKVTA
jgi:hypothetical protein